MNTSMLNLDDGVCACRQRLVDRRDLILTVVIGLTALGMYAATMARGLLPGDCAEFQLLANRLGSAHNPGYWVYLLLVRGFTLVPWGYPTDRVTFFSVTMAAITVAEVYLAGRFLTGWRWAGVFGAILLMVCPLFWSQAVIAEVYTAGTAFAGAILVLMLAWVRFRRGGLLFFAGVLGALSPGVHGTVALAAPAVLALLLMSRPDWKRTWKPALAGALVGVALLAGAFLLVDSAREPYNIMESAYIPSRSLYDASLEELQTPLGRFTFLITNRQWKTAMFQDVWVDTFENGGDYYRQLLILFSPTSLLMALLGLVSLWRRKALWVFFFLAGLAHHLFVFNYRINDIYTFYLTWFPYLCVLAAAGLAWLGDVLRTRLKTRSYLGGPILAVALIAVAVAPFAGLIVRDLWRGEVKFGEYTPYESQAELDAWAKTVRERVKSLPEDAVVLADWREIYPFWYVAVMELGRDDLVFMEPIPYSIKGGMAETMLDYLEEAAQTRPVLATRVVDELSDAGMKREPLTLGDALFYRYTQ